MARRKRKSISRDPYRFGDYERYTGMGRVSDDPFSMETFHPGQAIGHQPPSNLAIARRLREEMERGLLMRKLARFRRAEKATRVPLAPKRRAAAMLPLSHGQDDPQDQRGMKARQWVLPQDRRKDLARLNQQRALVQEANIAKDLKRREAEQQQFSLLDATKEGGLSLSPGSATQVGVQEVARDLIDSRVDKIREDLGLPDETMRSQPVTNRPPSARPRPEPWMTGRLGLVDPTHTAIPAGIQAQQAANMVEARADARKRRDRNIALAAVQELVGLQPGQASGAVPDYGYFQNLENEHMLRRRAKEFADQERERAIEFEQMRPTQPSLTQRALAQVLGVPVDLVAAGLNPLLEVLGAPEDVIKNPVGGREWLLKYFQTGGAVAVQNAKDALKKVYPAVEDVATTTTKFWGDKLDQAAKEIGVEKPSQIPAQVLEDATSFYGGKLDDLAGEIRAESKADIVPTLLADAEKFWKPRTREWGVAYDRWDKSRQDPTPDTDPGLLDAGAAAIDPAGTTGLIAAAAPDVTNVPPSLRPQPYGPGTGLVGPGIGREPEPVLIGGEPAPQAAGAPTAGAPTKDDQDKAIAAGSGKSGGSDVAGVPAAQLSPATREGLERVWGKYTYRPRERREKYMQQLKSIYQKAAWLDVISALSGGKSRSASYIERAVGMMDAMQKFDQEERLYNIWHDVYYDKNGNYDPPASKKEAAARARQLGATPQETKSIYGWAEEGEDLQQWWRPDGKGGYETKYTKGKKARPAAAGGAEWEMGSEPSSYHAATKDPKYIWAVPPGGGAAQYVDTRIVASQSGWTRPTKESGKALERAIDKAEEHLRAGNEEAARSELRLFFTGDPMNFIVFGKDIEKNIEDQIANIKKARGIRSGPQTIEEAVKIAIEHPSNAGKSPEEIRVDVEEWWKKNRGDG